MRMIRKVALNEQEWSLFMNGNKRENIKLAEKEPVVKKQYKITKKINRGNR
jgi:hypothetical protein